MGTQEVERALKVREHFECDRHIYSIYDIYTENDYSSRSSRMGR